MVVLLLRVCITKRWIIFWNASFSGVSGGSKNGPNWQERPFPHNIAYMCLYSMFVINVRQNHSLFSFPFFLLVLFFFTFLHSFIYYNRKRQRHYLQANASWCVCVCACKCKCNNVGVCRTLQSVIERQVSCIHVCDAMLNEKKKTICDTYKFFKSVINKCSVFVHHNSGTWIHFIISGSWFFC